MAELQQPLLSDSDPSHDESIQSTITSEAKPQATIDEALTYLKSVRDAFGDNSFEYANFLKLMKDYKAKRTDIKQVMSMVKVLFKEHRELIVGFNAFLPPGYEISLPLQDGSFSKAEFEEAIKFVNKVKAEFPNDNGRYKFFLDILNEYRNEKKSIEQVFQEVAILFHDRPDLLQDFVHFLPDTSKSMTTNAVRKTQVNKRSKEVKRSFVFSYLVLFFLASLLVAFVMGTRFGYYLSRN